MSGLAGDSAGLGVDSGLDSGLERDSRRKDSLDLPKDSRLDSPQDSKNSKDSQDLAPVSPSQDSPKDSPTAPAPKSTAHTPAPIQEFSEFLMDYAISMLAVGTYTSRVIKCTTRIGEAFGFEVHMSVFARNIHISVLSQSDFSLAKTYVRRYSESGINFRKISLLSALSWHAFDCKISLADLKARHQEILNSPTNAHLPTLFLVSLGNAAFCRLFGGDFWSILVVFLATFVAFNVRKILTRFGVDVRFIFVLSAFVASFFSFLFAQIIPTQTLDVALGTSVLFLIPGVYLINSIIDVFDGHSLIAISRAINAGILIVCIAIGLYATLSLTGLDYK